MSTSTGIIPYTVLTSTGIIPSRRLEDKFVNHKIELRIFMLNLSLQELHRNRELPAGFVCFLGVPDSTLPLRGTAHRSVRGAPEMEHEVNMFLATKFT